MTRIERAYLENRLYYLRFDMDCIGEQEELTAEIQGLSDADLVAKVKECEEELI